jgi:hypothetical protein
MIPPPNDAKWFEPDGKGLYIQPMPTMFRITRPVVARLDTSRQTTPIFATDRLPTPIQKNPFALAMSHSTPIEFKRCRFEFFDYRSTSSAGIELKRKAGVYKAADTNKKMGEANESSFGLKVSQGIPLPWFGKDSQSVKQRADSRASCRNFKFTPGNLAARWPIECMLSLDPAENTTILPTLDDSFAAGAGHRDAGHRDAGHRDQETGQNCDA